jgi:hypothetical protein
MSFAEGYVSVAERIAVFRTKYPEGCLRPHDPTQPITIITIADKTFLQYVACAYRAPDDISPGIGVAWEPFPGRTPFTKDSEAMVAETSAWGRAIVAALAADTHVGIASAEEIRSRSGAEPEQPPPLIVAKARAWNAAKALWTADTDDERKASTEAALAGMGSSIADADTDTWNTLADIWIAALEKAKRGEPA